MSKPYWWPVIIDADHLEELRTDYPERSRDDDEELLEYFEDGKELGDFSTTWDHVGDAYDDYKELATAFLNLVEETGKDPDDFK